MLKQIETFVKEVSRLVLDRVLQLHLNIAHYQPLFGSFYLDFQLIARRNSQSVTSRTQSEKRCFCWIILSALHQGAHNLQSVSHYRPNEFELHFDKIEFLVAVYVHSVMIYGSETWPIRAEDMWCMERNDMRMIWWMCNVSLKDRLTSDELRGRLNLESIWRCVQNRRLRWFGHIKRMDKYLG